MAWLPPLPVAAPLALAGLLLALSHVLPGRAPDVVAILTALAAAGICGAMALGTSEHPLIYWFGGWTPRGGVSLGISFAVDQASAGVAAFVAFLFAAALVFAWGFYADTHAHFHVLMLLFMAGMIGFCLTHDIFNLFVWFEVMSIAGYAATGYALRVSTLDAALNFTVVNTIGSYFFLGGIGLIYAQLGSLDFSALGRGVAAAPGNPVIAASFCLLAIGLLIKAAQVPFQFWLADAHSVAPSPVSVIFSGAMVALGVFGLAKLTWHVYAASPAVLGVIRTLLLDIGAASTIAGGMMALLQRHVKRLLAFSTISHIGILLIGFALLDRDGLAGMLAYLLGHGLVKAALFMVAGILLARCGGIDEIGLRGAGRAIWPAGILMGLGGLMLAGLPVGAMDEGMQLIDAGARHTSAQWGAAQWGGAHWAILLATLGSALTGAAVLRAAGRIFLGLGPAAGEEQRSPTEQEREKANRPLWLMLAPAAILMALGMLGLDGGGIAAARAARLLMGAPGEAGADSAPPLHGSLLPWASVGLALLLAGFELARADMPGWISKAVDAVTDPPFAALSAAHSGLIADYVVWIVLGLALFAGVFALR